MVDLKAFAAGFLATLLFHQGLVAILHAAGACPRKAYDLSPTKPLGIPFVLSLAFWGGLWGDPRLAARRGCRLRAAAVPPRSRARRGAAEPRRALRRHAPEGDEAGGGWGTRSSSWARSS